MPACKYLGVHINSNLSWSTHIETISGKASRRLGCVKRHLILGPPHLRQLTHETYVRPRLECASATCSPKELYLINRLEVIQNPAARLIASSYFGDTSITALKRSLGLVPLKYPTCNLQTGSSAQI